MSQDTRPTAGDIAADLALAIHRGYIRPGGQVPSQADLMQAYGVAMGTASAALGKLADAGLARGEPGRGTFALSSVELALEHSPVLDILHAADVCRHAAACTWPEGTAPVIRVGADPRCGTDYEDGERLAYPGHPVDLTALTGLDRHALRWMSEALYEAARRIAAEGVRASDKHLLAAVASILEYGGQRPERQKPIAVSGGEIPPGEDVIYRIWPERRNFRPGPDDPPF